MNLPETSTRPPRAQHRCTMLTALTTGLLLLAAGCGHPNPAPHAPSHPKPPTHQSYGWYAASPGPSHDPTDAFIQSTRPLIHGSDHHVLTVGRRICRHLSTTTITPLITKVSTAENIIYSPYAERTITNAITMLCDPVQPTDADQAYLDAVSPFSKDFTVYPDLTIYRGRDICYLLNHHTLHTTATTVKERAHVNLNTAHKLIATARRTLCTH